MWKRLRLVNLIMTLKHIVYCELSQLLLVICVISVIKTTVKSRLQDRLKNLVCILFTFSERDPFDRR